MHHKIYSMINPDDDDVIKLTRFKTVNTLHAGQNFGELAL